MIVSCPPSPAPTAIPDPDIPEGDEEGDTFALDKPPAAEIRYHRVVGPDQGGERLDKWLAEEVDGLSRARLRALLDNGRVTLDGETIRDASRRVKPGQDAWVTEPPPVAAHPKPQDIPLTVLYEDSDLIVIDKPAGLVVHPAAGNPDGTLVNALLFHCGDSLSGIGGERRPGIVHRLDKDTSGLMVAAKTDLAHRGLAEQFACHSLTREYHCLVWGRPKAAKGSVEGNIGRHPTNRKKMTVVPSGGKHALTHYRVLETFEDAFSLVECRLATGRTHQVRVHMAHLGHPLLGDAVYGRSGFPKALSKDAREAIGNLGRQALHSRYIRFLHPRTQEEIALESQLPKDINTILTVSRTD
jgi:23S rRNA pseudouridine1911/1915/1917 synthase